MSIRLKIWPLEHTQGKKLMTHDRHSTITIAHSKHFVLRWAKNSDLKMCLNLTDTYKPSNKQEGHDSPGSLTWVIFPTKWILPPLVLLFQFVTPGVRQVLTPGASYEWNVEGPQGDATYQKSKLYPFQFQRRRILKLVFLVPIFQLVTPGKGQFWAQGNHMNKLGRGLQGDAIYQIWKL